MFLQVCDKSTLHSRVLVSSQPGCTRSVEYSVGRPLKYKNYDRSNLEKAVFVVSKMGMSTRRAALEYDIPQSTLSDNVRGRVCLGAVSGRKKYLTHSEEEELVTFIIKSAEIGYGYAVREIMNLVQDTIDKKGIQATISHGWWDGFRARCPCIVKRRPEPMTHVCAQGACPEVLEKFA